LGDFQVPYLLRLRLGWGISYIYIYIYECCHILLVLDVIEIIDLPETLPETFRKLPDCRFYSPYLRRLLTGLPFRPTFLTYGPNLRTLRDSTFPRQLINFNVLMGIWIDPQNRAPQKTALAQKLHVSFLKASGKLPESFRGFYLRTWRQNSCTPAPHLACQP